MNFTISDGGGDATLPVVYKGVVPDTFSAGIEVVVEGRLNQDGVFRAEVIMPKCPSRYTPSSPQ